MRLPVVESKQIVSAEKLLRQNKVSIGDTTGKKKTVEIAVVDDHELFMLGISALIQQMGPQFHVSGFTAGAQFLAALNAGQKFDLLLTDLAMKQINGLALVAAVRRREPQIPIIIVTGVENALAGTDLATIGADAVMHKAASSDELQAVVSQVLSKPGLRDSVASGRAAANFPTAARDGRFADIPKLAPKQVEILHLLDHGASNAEISKAMGITENTVKTHLKAIFAKLGVTNRTASMKRARELGLL